MIKPNICIFLITFLFSFNMYAQSDCACCTPQYQKFDFWVGDWVVFDTTGKEVGRNLIEKLEDNCILNENWVGASGNTGKSYNYFNKQDSTWNQLWIDNTGSHLELKGDLIDGKMVLESGLLKGQRIAFYKNRITWGENEDGSVTQTWDILDENGSHLNTVFVGIYKKK